MPEIDLKISELKNMLKEVHCITGVNFSEYAFSFLKRRTEEFMKENKIVSDTDFIYRINKSFGVAGSFLEKIYVPDSEMFRDAEMWNFFLEKILKKCNDKNEIKIHLPYSISGEELFSLLFVLEHFKNSKIIDITVSAVTDVHLQKIKNTQFNSVQIKASAKNIEILDYAKDSDDVFELKDKNYIVKENFKGKLNYEVCDFFKEKYINEFDVVFYRNKTIYFNKELKTKALKIITRSLQKGAFLIMGAGETPDEINKKKFKLVNKGYSIYKKKTLG